MLFPKLALGIILSTLGLISFAIPQDKNISHTPFAYLLPYVTNTPAKIENAKFIPSKLPTHNGKISAKTLEYTIHITPTPTSSHAIQAIVPSSSVTPTQIPSTPIPTTQPVNSQPTSTMQAFIMQAINDYRHSNGLGSVSTNDLTCNFATIRAQEITTDFSHDGFTNRLNAHTMPYPNYSLITENIAETGDYKDVVNLWANSPQHAANMRADTPYICVEQSGDYYAMEGWKSL